VTGDGIPEAVKALIAEHIRSVMELESLLLFHANPRQDWSVADVAREMRVDPAWVAPKLGDMARRGLLAESGPNAPRYRYAPRTAALDETVAMLARIYADRRVSVIEFIFSKPSGSIQSFADAFRLRRERQDG
jgi:hypothetical protein